MTAKPHQRASRKAPTPGLRDWRDEMARPDLESFERVAGDLLAELGYELDDAALLALPASERDSRSVGIARRVAARRGLSRAVYRSPLWRRRHPYVR